MGKNEVLKNFIEQKKLKFFSNEITPHFIFARKIVEL